jgi:hypothetical protein
VHGPGAAPHPPNRSAASIVALLTHEINFRVLQDLPRLGRSFRHQDTALSTSFTPSDSPCGMKPRQNTDTSLMQNTIRLRKDTLPHESTASVAVSRYFPCRFVAVHCAVSFCCYFLNLVDSRVRTVCHVQQNLNRNENWRYSGDSPPW